MKIAGYEILREKGHWIEEGRLYSPLHYQRIIDHIAKLIEHPDYEEYRLYGELFKFNRLRIDNLRVFVRIHPGMMIVTILAVTIKGAITADEKSGTMDRRFTNYLKTCLGFRLDRFSPLLSLEEFEAGSAPVADTTEYYVASDSPPVPEPSFPWGPVLTYEPLSEVEAADLLLGTNITRPMGQISANLLTQVERAFPGDKVLVPLPPGSDEWENWMIRSLQSSIKHRLMLMGKNYSVRYDDISRKFILIPPDKIGVYALTNHGRRARVNIPLEAQNVGN